MPGWYRVARAEARGLPVAARVSTLPTPPAATPAVCVHGLAISGRYMTPLARRLARKRPTFVPDLPGYGLSPGREDWPLDVPSLADALAAWMDAAGVGPAVLVGNSMGCQIVADLAARRFDLARAVVLVGPTVDARARTPLAQLGRLVVDTGGEPPALVALEAFDTLQVGLRRAVALGRAALADRIEDKLPRVRCPTLVVRGERDALVPRAWATEVAGALRRGSYAEVPGPHVANWGEADVLARTIQRWLEAEGVAAAS